MANRNCALKCPTIPRTFFLNLNFCMSIKSGYIKALLIFCSGVFAILYPALFFPLIFFLIFLEFNIKNIVYELRIKLFLSITKIYKKSCTILSKMIIFNKMAKMIIIEIWNDSNKIRLLKFNI
jgi:hypothetical protein